MSKFRKKPVVIEAIQYCWSGEKFAEEAQDEIADFIGKNITVCGEDIEIETLEGTMTARRNDWIIKGVNGEFYPCKPDIFAKTYDLAD